MNWIAVGKTIFGFVEPLFKPVMVLYYGWTRKRQGYADAKADANKHFNKVTSDAADAGNAAKLRDVDPLNDPYNRD